MNLRQDLQNLRADIDAQINIIIKDISNDPSTSGSALNMRDTNGQYILVPLIVAKAQVLSALVEMEKLND